MSLTRRCINGAPAPYAGDFCFGKSHQNHLRLRLRPSGSLIASVASAGPRRDSPCPCGGRATCSASLPLLSLASPGFALHGKPVQRGKGPLDLCLYPLHPPRAPSG